MAATGQTSGYLRRNDSGGAIGTCLGFLQSRNREKATWRHEFTTEAQRHGEDKAWENTEGKPEGTERIRASGGRGCLFSYGCGPGLGSFLASFANRAGEDGEGADESSCDWHRSE